MFQARLFFLSNALALAPASVSRLFGRLGISENSFYVFCGAVLGVDWLVDVGVGGGWWPCCVEFWRGDCCMER